MKLILSVILVTTSIVLGYLFTEKPSELKLIDQHLDPSVKIYVDTRTLEDHVINGTVVRRASVVYAFKNPQHLKGHEVHYLYREVGFLCKFSSYITSRVILFGNSSSDEILDELEPGMIEAAEFGTLARIELSSICSMNVTKTVKINVSEQVRI